MNIEETKKAIEVMQAFVDGKTIEHRNKEPERRTNDRYYPCDGKGMPMWNLATTEYRIKPEPKEIWVNEYERSHNDYLYYDKETAEENAAPYALRVAVRYREVIEE